LLFSSLYSNTAVPRIDYIRGLRTAVRFLSREPLVEYIGEIDLNGIAEK
jgi:protein gp37